jgi:hypothetical protein
MKSCRSLVFLSLTVIDITLCQFALMATYFDNAVPHIASPYLHLLCLNTNAIGWTIFRFVVFTVSAIARVGAALDLALRVFSLCQDGIFMERMKADYVEAIDSALIICIFYKFNFSNVEPPVCFAV